MVELQSGSKWQVRQSARSAPPGSMWEWERAIVLRVELAHVLVAWPDRSPVWGTHATSWLSIGVFQGSAHSGWGF
jgi:hypothetical protein